MSEFTLTADEKGVSGKDGLVLAILEQVTDAVLSVARSVQGLDLDASDVEDFAVCGYLGHLGAVPSADDGERVCFELHGS